MSQKFDPSKYDSFEWFSMVKISAMAIRTGSKQVNNSQNRVILTINICCYYLTFTLSITPMTVFKLKNSLSLPPSLKI